VSDYDYPFKALIIGNSCVGKSCLLLRFTEGISSENSISTIGVGFWTGNFDLEETTTKLQIRDIAGQDRFRTITKSYYQGSNAIAIVYDITGDECFSEVETHAGRHVCRLLVGNKADPDASWAVKTDEGTALARQFGIQFIETSALNSSNVDVMFLTMARAIKEIACGRPPTNNDNGA
jgi:Ras-related protein Rab-1A